MTERNNPLDGLEELLERLSRQFETAARSWGTQLDDRSRLDLSAGRSSMRLDLAEEGDEFVVTADVPGYGSDDLTLELRGESLQLSGERDQQVTEETRDPDDFGATYLRRERGTRSFSRTVHLPEPIDTESVTATVNNGILTVHLPKLEATAGSRTIDIE